MDKNQLYDIEMELYKKLDGIKAEQKQYTAGVEKGIDMTVSAVRKGLNAESQSSTNNCIYCHFENDVGAKFPETNNFIIRNKNNNGKYDHCIARDKNDIFYICDIRFCPMCGRLLENEEEAE